MNPVTGRGLFYAVVCSVVVLIQGPVQSQAPAAGVIRLEVQSGSKAEYRVREQLARLNFPNDAVGTTEAVTGAFIIRPDGSFTPDSKLIVDLRTLKTDEPKRDGYVRANTLQTDRFPNAEFVPRRNTLFNSSRAIELGCHMPWIRPSKSIPSLLLWLSTLRFQTGSMELSRLTALQETTAADYPV